MTNKYSRLVDAGEFAAECGDPCLAEVVLTRALQHADQFLGTTSSVSGVILVDLIEFYERHGSRSESNNLRRRLQTLVDLAEAAGTK